MISNYMILKYTTAHSMETEVVRLLREGWQLHGTLINAGPYLLQAMTYSPDINRDLEGRR